MIGKVKLDLSRYGGRDLYCDGEVEDELLSIAREHTEEEFPALIAERRKWPILYHLSDLRGNIVDWIRLKSGAKVLEVGAGCGAVTGTLAKKAGHLDCVDLSKKRSMINAWRHRDAENICIHVGNFEDIEPDLDSDYDAIFLIGVFEYAASYIHDADPYGSFLRIIRKHLKKDGLLVIAIENRLGMKYFGGAREDHLGSYFSGIEDYPGGGVVRTFSRPALEKRLRAEGIDDYHFYYPYPDYKFMLSLYSDRRLPQEGELSTNHLRLDRDRMELFDESRAYDAAIRDGVFPLFSNSYLLLIGPESEVVYSKYSNDRAPRYAIRTDILEKNGERFALKVPMRPEAAEHVKSLAEKAKRMEERFEGSALSVCPAQEEGDAVRFPFVEGPTMEEELGSALQRGDTAAAKELLKQYRKLQEYRPDCPAGNRDIQFSNLIRRDSKWVLIDYEWVGKGTRDIKKDIERALFLFKEYHAQGNALTEELLREVFPELSQPFDSAALRERERAFQKSITQERTALGEMNELLGFRIEKSREEGGGELFRPRIYRDSGNGFSESESSLADAVRQPDGSLLLEVPVTPELKAFRFDPCMHACILELIDVEGKCLRKLLPFRAGENGRALTERSWYFADDDPNVSFFAGKGEGTVRIRYRIKAVKDLWEQ